MRQSNPSTLTVAGLRPNFILTQPPFRGVADDEGDGKPDGEGRGNVNGVSFSSPKRASCTNGLAALLGGDPEKNGGDDATGITDCPVP